MTITGPADKHTSTVDRLLTSKEAAERLNVSGSWLAKSRMRGDGPPYIEIGRTIRYKITSLSEYIKSRERRSTSGR